MKYLLERMAQLQDKQYLFLSSTDSLDYFPTNNPTDFTVELQERLFFSGKWECTLLQILFQKKISEPVLVLCDICENSVIKGTKLPILRLINTGFFRQNDSFEQLIKIPISRSQTQRIRIYLRTVEGQIPSFIDEPVRCTLLLNNVS